jgi:hypothetical protein
MEEKSSYRPFYIMLGLSLIIMYSVMFLNVYSWDHVYLSINRLYLSILMVAPMAFLMPILMPKMLKDKKKNAVIMTASTVVFVIVLILLRTQTFIGDVQYMKAMIPHHSSAILTSNQADITDAEVKNLSVQIIETQEEEIAEMKEYLDRLQ